MCHILTDISTLLVAIQDLQISVLMLSSYGREMHVPYAVAGYNNKLLSTYSPVHSTDSTATNENDGLEYNQKKRKERANRHNSSRYLRRLQFNSTASTYQYAVALADSHACQGTWTSSAAAKNAVPSRAVRVAMLKTYG